MSSKVEVSPKFFSQGVDLVSASASTLLPKLAQDYLAGIGAQSEMALSAYPHTFEGAVRALNYRRVVPFPHREVMVEAFREGYRRAGIVPNELQERSLIALSFDGFTVTTGHQCVLFGGPQYVMSKALTTCRLAEDLADRVMLPVVPVFWLASEDHDWDEARSVQLRGNTVMASAPTEWTQGPVGRIPLEAVQIDWGEVEESLGAHPLAEEFTQRLKAAFLGPDEATHHTWAQASFRLINELMAPFGGLVLEPDQPALKELFREVMVDELTHGRVTDILKGPLREFERHYKVQAHPRPVNLFALLEGKRVRIDETLTQEEAQAFAPESLSPGVLMRPLYQETILPNVAYVGGPSEIAYWLELKPLFAHYGLPMPMVCLRNMVMMVEEELDRKADRLGLTLEDLLLQEPTLLERATVAQAPYPGFESVRQTIENQRTTLIESAGSIDFTLKASAEAALRKMERALENLEGKARRLHRKRFEEARHSALHLRGKLLPGGVPKERTESYLATLLYEEGELTNALSFIFEAVPTKLWLVSRSPFRSGSESHSVDESMDLLS